MKSNNAEQKPLADKVAIVAGATRGAGRGIACMLGEAGAVVYCTGRSVSGAPPKTGVHKGRTETIEETAEMVSVRGGVGVPVRVDHTDEAQVAALIERVRQEQEGQLDILVNVIGGDTQAEWKPFWQQSVDGGLRWLNTEVGSHIITSRHAAALMVERQTGLIVEITDGDNLGYRGSFFYDLVKLNTIRLAYAMAEELKSKNVAAIAVTPGFMRTEAVLDQFGATEDNWREVAETNAQAKSLGFIGSETPCFVGRAIAALAADPRVLEKSGGVYASWTLADEYGFADVDGNRPHLGRFFAENFPHLAAAKAQTGFRWKIERETQPLQSPKQRTRAKRAS
jgi:NAD(P)-dependent dehydrogenase (short-subunit alcohol dehydrogenase family)